MLGYLVFVISSELF